MAELPRAASAQADITRRRFLGTVAAVPVVAGLAGVSPRRAAAPRVVVVGAGAFGGWTALHLRRRGAAVTLVDAWGPGNPRASSGGESRVIRAVYGPDRIYVEWVKRAFAQWAALAGDSGAALYDETGSLWMFRGDEGYMRSSLPILEELGFPVERPSVAEAAQRWPQIDFTGIRGVYLERRAGVLAAREACRVVRDRFVAEGGDYRVGRALPPELDAGGVDAVRLEDGARLAGDQIVFACGPWLGELFPDVVGDHLRPSRQEVFYFGVPAGSRDYGPDRLPVWIDFGERIVYGLPDVHGRGFKIADDTRGERFDPTHGDRTPSAAGLAGARELLGTRFPAMRDAPLLETRVCQYENSPDGHLIVDRHPEAANLWLLGGGSGHGFKLAPALGEHAARRVLDGEPGEEMFGFARLGKLESTATQFQSGGAK